MRMCIHSFPESHHPPNLPQVSSAVEVHNAHSDRSFAALKDVDAYYNFNKLKTIIVDLFGISFTTIKFKLYLEQYPVLMYWVMLTDID